MAEASPKKIGKGMMIAAWIVALLLFSQFFANWEKKQYNPNASPESSTGSNGSRKVILERNRAGHYITNGMINGAPVTFMLDTGATDVVIPEAIAKTLGLPRLAYSEASTANGTISIYKTRLNSLSIGNIKLYDVRASINPSMTAEQEILLGMSALKQLELRQKDRRLTLIQG